MLPQQALLKFDNMFGGGIGQVPTGAKIFDAFLTLNVTQCGVWRRYSTSSGCSKIGRR